MNTLTVKPFAGELRKFELGMGDWEILQTKLKQGPLELERAFRGMSYTPTQLKETLKHGLIGGGTPEGEAITLVEATIVAGTLLRYLPIAHEIIVVFIGTDEEEELPPKKPAPRKAATKRGRKGK